MIVPKNMKFLGINLTKDMKDLYNGINKTFLRDTEDLNKCGDIPCAWIRRLSINMSVIPKLVNAIPIKITPTSWGGN